MVKKLLLISLTAVFVLLTACDQGGSTGGEATLMPSEALNQINMEYREKAATAANSDERTAIRKSIAESYLDQVKSANLTGEEELQYAEILFIAGQDDKAMEIGSRLAAGNDVVARAANIKLMDVMIQKEEYDSLATAVEDYRAKFEPTPDYPQDLFNPLVYLMYHYGENGQPEKAVEIVESELERLPTNAPYAGFNLIDYGAGFFESAGKTAELEALARDRLETFKTIVEERNANAPADAGEDYAKTTQGYERLVRNLGNTLTRLELIGSPAPGFTFTHYFNTDPVSLDDLKGKVVMIDFWANWCGPCKAAFPSMRELYDQYKDQGFVILGVTSMQGRFYDGDIQEGEVAEDKELELTKDFIARHEMTWPIAFSDKNVYDERYGVGGIPTFAVLDKKGVVRLIQVGSGEESERKLQEIVPKLLAE